MKSKAISILISAVLTASVLAGCGLSAGSTGADSSAEEYPAADDPKVVLTMAEVNPEDSIVGQMDLKFCEEVERLSGGSLKIELQASGVLGEEEAVLEKMMGKDDEIDLARISAFALEDYGCTKAKLLSLPYAFVSREHFWKFADSDLALNFLMEPEELGLEVQGVFYGEEGFRNFFTVEPVAGIEDFKGKKIRVSSDLLKDLLTELGAEPAEIPFTELYAALQTEILDGAEQPTVNYRSNSFEKVAPNLILDGHTLGIVEVIITNSAVNKLTDNQIEVLEEAGRIASEFNREMSENEEKKVLEELRNEGINIVEVEDKTPWQEAAQKLVEENVGGDIDIYDQLEGLK